MSKQLTQKEYIDNIAAIVEKHVFRMIYEKIRQKFNFISSYEEDIQRTLYFIINRQNLELKEEIELFISKTGIPRKQRVHNKKKADEKNKINECAEEEDEYYLL
jgi:hypothetical protein